MTSRPDAKLVREIVKSKKLALAEKQRLALAKEKLIKKGWRKQLTAIINAAVDGGFHYDANEIYEGELLINLGFTLYEIHSPFKEPGFTRLTSDASLLDYVINKNIDQFLRVSETGFKNPNAYRDYVIRMIDNFINRAQRIKDTKDKFALLNFLNSDFYTAFGSDGGFNSYTDILVRLNNAIDLVVSDERYLPKNNSEKIKYLASLLPLSEFKIEKLKAELIKVSEDTGFFRVSWRYPEVINNKREELGARTLSWLSGSAGQNLMDFIFKCIEKSNENSIMFNYNEPFLYFKRGNRVKMLPFTPNELKQVLTAKGYKIFLNDTEIKVSW